MFKQRSTKLLSFTWTWTNVGWNTQYLRDIKFIPESKYFVNIFFITPYAIVDSLENYE